LCCEKIVADPFNFFGQTFDLVQKKTRTVTYDCEDSGKFACDKWAPIRYTKRMREDAEDVLQRRVFLTKKEKVLLFKKSYEFSGGAC